MNDALREAEAVDPKWAKSEQRKLWMLKGITAAVILALAVGTVSFVLGLHNSTEITQVEHSACQVEPGGAECQKTKAESSRAASLRVTCIPFFKAGYPCPKPGSTAAQRVARRQSLRAHPVQGAPSSPTQSEGGGATSSPSTGHSLPGRHEGGSSGSEGESAPGDGGSHHAPVSGEGASEAAPATGTPTTPASTAPASPGTSSSSTTERTTETTVVEGAPAPESAPTPEAPVRQGAGALLESVGGVVEETGGTVNEVVGGVTGTTCSLAKLLCHE